MRRENLLQLPAKRRRGHGFGQDAKARALGRRLRRQAGADRGDERAPRSNLAELHNRLRAIGVVQRQQRRLRVEIGRAKASRMIGVAFGLRGASFVAFDQQARGDAAERHGRREEQRTAGDFFFGLANVRDDQLIGLNRAGRAHAGQRQRRTHQLEERTTADRIDPLGGVLGELAMEVLLELRRIGERLEAAPVLLAPGAAHARANLGQIRCPRLLHVSPKTFAFRFRPCHGQSEPAAQLPVADRAARQLASRRQSCSRAPTARRSHAGRPPGDTPS